MLSDLEPFLGGWDYFLSVVFGISAEVEVESFIFTSCCITIILKVILITITGINVSKSMKMKL